MQDFFSRALPIHIHTHTYKRRFTGCATRTRRPRKTHKNNVSTISGDARHGAALQRGRRRSAVWPQVGRQLGTDSRHKWGANYAENTERTECMRSSTNKRQPSFRFTKLAERAARIRRARGRDFDIWIWGREEEEMCDDEVSLRRNKVLEF